MTSSESPKRGTYARLLRYAVWLLGRRAYTTQGLAEKLRQKAKAWESPSNLNREGASNPEDQPPPTQASVDSNPVEAVLSRLTELKFLNDLAFCEQWVEERNRLRPRGRRALDQELARKGVSSETRAQFWQSPSGETFDEIRAAERLLQKHLPRLRRRATGYDLRQRGMTLLARQGFSIEASRRALASTFSKEESEDVDIEP